MKSLFLKTLTSIAIASVMSGCMSTADVGPLPNDPFYAPIVPESTGNKIAEDGSIFQRAMANGLYSDVKAHRVGDIITVILSENTSATKSATTDFSRETDIALNPIVGLGAQNVNIGGQSIQLGVDSTNEFAGDSSANQSNNLSGRISVTVVQVLPNKNLVIRGEKWLTLNNGDEFIRVTGVVRPTDISPTNQIVSTNIANARIQYSGTGKFASTQQQGWLSNFFSSELWPF